MSDACARCPALGGIGVLVLLLSLTFGYRHETMPLIALEDFNLLSGSGRNTEWEPDVRWLYKKAVFG